MIDKEAEALIRELRMGNWLRHIRTERWFQFQHADFDLNEGWIIVAGNFNGFPVKDNYLEAIPITHDILKRCGFDYDGVTWSNGPVMLAFSKEGSTWFPCGLSGTDRAKVLYLHHLQNIYFALTGKELEVQP